LGTASSVKTPATVSAKLLENDIYDFTGTDVHNQKHLDQLTKKCFFQYFREKRLIPLNA